MKNHFDMKRTQKNHSVSNRKIGQILGINVISGSTSSLLMRVEDFISDSIKFYIVTPNPELVLMAQRNKKLKEALNSADLPVPDTVRLNYASKFLFGESLNIIPGRKLFIDLINLSGKKGWKVFLLGGMGNEAEIASRKLQITNYKLQIRSFNGPKLDDNAEPTTEADRKLQKRAIARINRFVPELLFVAFGNPKQEIWIHKNISKLNIGGAMAVGGAFRYVAGLSALPPGWMEKAGLEWLWRLINEPMRIGRIFNAVIVFPLKVFIYKISQ